MAPPSRGGIPGTITRQGAEKMDGATSSRKFPSYTTAQLEAAVADGRGTPAMIAEIEARKNGTSKILVTPQIMGGKPINKIGRM